MEKLRIDNLSKWICTKLGENVDNPKLINEYGEIINRDEFELLNGPDTIYYRINRKSIDRTARGDEDDDVYKNNKNICDLFADDLNTNKIVIYTYKGNGTGYIISNKNYNRYNYWDKKYWESGFNGTLDLPFIYNHRYSWIDGTLDMLGDLIEKTNYIIPDTGCKYTKKTQFIDKYSKYWRGSTYNWKNLNIDDMKNIYYESLFYIMDYIMDFKNHIYKKNKDTIFEDIYIMMYI